jgi:cytidine deaminase
MAGVNETLIQAAGEAAEFAYAPYSGFAVGAALLTSDGRVFTGANVENASYSLTICAERVALVKAVTEGARQFEKLALVSTGDKPVLPCGACLQALAEFAPALIIIAGSEDGPVEYRLQDLLAVPFKIEDEYEH